MNFNVGQKVVCVDDGWNEVTTTYEIQCPTKGAVYTVRALTVGWPEFGSVPALLLDEVRNPKDPCFASGEVAFGRRRFRPAVERSTETGMAVLRKIASDITTKITEKV